MNAEQVQQIVADAIAAEPDGPNLSAVDSR